MVRVGSARSNENGGINGGKPGDQKNGREVSTQDWYLHTAKDGSSSGRKISKHVS